WVDWNPAIRSSKARLANHRGRLVRRNGDEKVEGNRRGVLEQDLLARDVDRCGLAESQVFDAGLDEEFAELTAGLGAARRHRCTFDRNQRQVDIRKMLTKQES